MRQTEVSNPCNAQEGKGSGGGVLPICGKLEPGSHGRDAAPPVPQGLQRGRAAAALMPPKLILAKLNFFHQFADGKGVGRPLVSSSSAST